MALSTQNTQSLTDFRQNATETLERLNRTGEAEIITVNGEAKAVVMSPAAYDEMMRELDDAKYFDSVRRAMREADQGLGEDVDVVFDRLKKKLLAKMVAQSRGGRK